MSMDRLRVGGLSAEARERLSALSDGEASADELHLALSAWRDDARARAGTCETWHAYHLIGDVMRSEDLCGSGRDDVFLSRLRERLAAEPVVVAPMAAPVAAQPQLLQPSVQVANGTPVPARRRSWVAPMATVAGVMAVAGVLVVTRLSVPPGAGEGAQLAQASSAASALQPVALSASASADAAEPALIVGNGALLRDARLDQYLNAHKEFAGSSALGVPSGFLRSSTYEGPKR
ncbi:sigma-E factor negative regulatory protein [Eleftheria terrae]|uniref:sigma-E factor negative regulatory protein n=1 Tax=Eleftheria terrae TaxID=1597781 RepID=UPI00263A78B3|nr:sigma-E factor negative regulatory protein [Eleftheria terrae]WKB54587.1 sigma-E factor negative regulatory protein [Eleftheria terrae]